MKFVEVPAPTPSRTVPLEGPLPKGEIVTIDVFGENALPQRRAGSARDPRLGFLSILKDLLPSDTVLDERAVTKAIEARSVASLKALGADLRCYARFVAEDGGIGLPGPVGPKLRFWSSWRTRRERAGCC